MANPVDRSLAFTALLDLSPEFGRMDLDRSGGEITRFLADYYESGQTNMYAYARGWLRMQQEVTKWQSRSAT